MWPPPEGVYWFERLPADPLPALVGRVEADAAVVGGGIAGLAAAQRLAAGGLRVVVVEADSCGRGATGRSSGFITPDSEMQLSDLTRRFGDDPARSLYREVRRACDDIRAAATRQPAACDLIEADCLWAAGGPSSTADIRREHGARTRLGFDSALLDAAAMRTSLGTDAFPAAVRYGGTFGVSGAGLARVLREELLGIGVRIYERSQVIEVGAGRVRTAGGEVHAPRIVVTVDRAAPSLGLASRTIYQARAYLLLSEPLPRAMMERCFPSGPMMVWDTDLIYQYFRPTRDGRLLIGGGTLGSVYALHPGRSEPIHLKLAHYLVRVFPFLSGLEFTHRWEGLIGTTKDFLPLAGPVREQQGLWVALGGAGLPWSVLAGWLAADSALGRTHALASLFDPERAFTTIDPLQPALGKRASWMLGNLLARRFERGGSQRVAARQRALKLGLGTVMVAGVAAAALAFRKRS